jgi:hypothetical protein
LKAIEQTPMYLPELEANLCNKKCKKEAVPRHEALRHEKYF